MTGKGIGKPKLPLVLFLCWVAVVPTLSAFAQAESWSKLSGTVFEHLGPSSGLSNLVVNAVAQDNEGFLWVGTSSGLARWDGYRFRVYGAGGREAALPDNFIQCLHTDPGGTLWAGLSAGGLARYDRTQDRFIVVPLDSQYSDRVVYTLADDGTGGLWIGTDAGLEHLTAGAGAATHVGGSTNGGDGPPNQRVHTLLRDRNGNLWVGTSEGLYRLDQGSTQFVPVPIPAAKTIILALFEDSDERLWIGTVKQGAFSLGKGETIPLAVHENGSAGPGIEGQRVTAITEGTPGQIWFSTDGQGIVILDTTTGRTRRLRHDQAQPTSLLHDDVWTLYRDPSGQIWSGSTGGLDRYDPSQTAISSIFGGGGGAGGLSKPDVRSVLPLDDKQVWLGLGDEGIDIVRPDEGRVIDLRAKAGGAAAPLPHDVVTALVKFPKGSIFAGTRRGLFRIDGASGGTTRVTISPEAPEMEVGTLMAQGSVLWVGARNDGLWRYVEGTGAGGKRIGLGQLTDPRIRALAPGPEGRLWVGTRNGLNLVDPATEEVERILPEPRDSESLSAGLVSSLLTDRQGRLWVSTEGGGIDLLERRDAGGRPRFRHFGTEEGLPHANVDKLLMDKSGRIWASTDDGLASIDPDSFAIRSFRRAEGVAISTYWINSGDVTEKGDLLFGGVGGLTVVHPDRITDWTYVPPVVITDLRVGGKAVPAGRFGAKEPVAIRPEANSIAVEFAALDFSAPERNRYAYKLEGFDADWVETDSTRRLASYTNLQPGAYTLRLRGSNRDGVWAEASLDLPIRVLPAWYQTLWFRGVMVLIGASLIVLLVRSRTAYYRQRQERLERQVEIRTRELDSKSSQLKALLDNSGQGFLSFGTDLVIDGEYSLACETMLGLVPFGMTADQALFAGEEKKAELFRKTAQAIRECKDFKRRNVMITLFPREIKRGGLMIDTTYRRINDGRLMAILTDVTESRRLSEKLDANYRRQDMVVAAVTQSRDFFETVEGYRQFLEVELPEWLARDEMPEASLAEMFRTVHTFKGVLSQFSFERSPSVLHELEDVLSDFASAGGDETMEMLRDVVDLGPYRRALAFDLAVIEGLLGAEFVENGARIAVSADRAESFAMLARRLLDGEQIDPAGRELLRDLSRVHHVGLDQVLHGFDRVVRQVAEAQGKAVAPLSVEGGEGLLVDPTRYHGFFQALVHVFRNAVSHGIESPDQRVDAGKDEAGTIQCRVTHRAGFVTITVADDGAGIDVERLRAKLAEASLPAEASDEAVMQAVFLDQVSTKAQVDEFSGRGVGLGAVWQAVEALGGTAEVSSVPRKGTVFTFTLPMDDDF